MSPEWIITGLVSIIGTLSGAVLILWRNHLAADQRERERADTTEAELRETNRDFRAALRRGKPAP